MGVDDNPIKESKHRLRQRFEVLRKLGHGTYGKVQLAVNKDTGQEVAIKTIKKAKIENEQDLIRIRREIQIMSYVQHPHIIHIHEVFENKEKIVLVMQYASGGEMYDYLKSRKSLAETEARRIFRQIVSAVYYCHKNRICHRDLKLENILLDEKGNAKIADFGLSNIFSENNFLHTFCGSPLYASPEIVRGKPYYGPEVDCWSLGVLLYTFIYGAMPFDGSNFRGLVKQISEGDYYEPKKKSDASGLIRHLLTIQPTKRATIFDICNHWWVNLGYEHSLMQVAEDMANFSPVNMDALLNMPYLKACEENKSSPMKCSNNIKLSSDNQSKVFVEKKDEKNETVSNYILNTIERNDNLVNSNSISCSDDSLMLNDLESPGNGITTPNDCSHSSTDKAFAFPENNMKKPVRKITENSHDINRRSKETSIISEQDNVTQNKLNTTDNILIRKRSDVESVPNKNLCSKNETSELCSTSKSKEETCIKSKQIKQSLDKKISISQSLSNQTSKSNDSVEYSVIINRKNFVIKNKETEESLSVQNNENEKCKKLKENECILIDKKSNNARISTDKINTKTEEYIDSNISELKLSNKKTEVTNIDNKEKINISEGKSSEAKTENNLESTDVSLRKDFIQNSVEKMETEKCQDSKTRENDENKKISVKKGPGKLIIPKFFESSQPTKGADTKKVNIPSWAVSDAKKAFESKTQEKKPLIIPTRRVSDARNKFEQKIESNAYITLPRRASKQSTILNEEINEQRRKSDTNDFPIKELPSLNNSNENSNQNEEIKSDDQKNLEIGIKKTSKTENENDIKSENNNNTYIENHTENSIVISENSLSLTSESLKKENYLQETIHKSVDSENCPDTQDHKFDLSSSECNINDYQTDSSDIKRFSNNSTIPMSSPIHKVLPTLSNIVTEKINKSHLPIANSEINNTTIEEISKLNPKAYQIEETQNNILSKEQDDYTDEVCKNNVKEEAHLKNNVHTKEHEGCKNIDDKSNIKISRIHLKNNILTKESESCKNNDDKNNNKIEETHLNNNVLSKELDECKNQDDKNNIEENDKMILNKTEDAKKQNNNNNNNNLINNKENTELDKFEKLELTFNLQNQNQSHFSNKEFSYVETEMEHKSKENKNMSHSKRRNSDVSLFSTSSEKYNALGLRDIHDLPESCYNDMLQFLHSKETSRSRYSSLLSKQKHAKNTLNKDRQTRIHGWIRSEQINGHSTDRDSSDNDEDFDIHFDYSYPTVVNSNMLSSLDRPESNSKSVDPTNKYPRTMRSISQIDYNSIDEIPKTYKCTNSLSNEAIDNPIELPNKELKFTRRNSHSTIYKDSINLNSSSLHLQNPVFKPLSSYEIQNNPQLKRISNATEVYGTWHRKSSCHSNHQTFQQQRDRFYTSSPINETLNRSNLISSGMIREIYGTIRRPKHNYSRSISVDIPQNPTIYDKLQSYPSQEYSSINTHQENNVFNIKDCRNSYLQNKYSSHASNYNKNKISNKSDSLKLSTEDIVKNNEDIENQVQNNIELSYSQNYNDKDIKCTEEKLITKQDSNKNLNSEHTERICEQDIQKFPLQIPTSSNQSHINTDKLSSLSLLEALKLKGYRNVISQQNPLFLSKSKVSEENSFAENFDIKLKMNNPLEELTENKTNLEIPQMNHSNLQPLIEMDNDVKEKLAPVCEMNEFSTSKVDSDQEETVSERIWRKSFYSRFNDNRMKKRKTYREGDLKAQSLSGSNWNVLIEENLRDDYLYPRRSSLTVGNNYWSSLPRSSAKPLVKHHSYEGPNPVLQFSDSIGNNSKHRCSKMSRRSSSLGVVEDGLDVHKNTAYLNILQQSHNAVSSDYNIPYSSSVGSNYNKLHGTIRPFSIYNSGNSSKEEYLSEENFKSRINSSNTLSRRRFSALDNYLFTSKSPSLSDSVTSLIDYDKPENEEVS